MRDELTKWGCLVHGFLLSFLVGFWLVGRQTAKKKCLVNGLSRLKTWILSQNKRATPVSSFGWLLAY